jgi:hypothetical protein
MSYYSPISLRTYFKHTSSPSFSTESNCQNFASAMVLVSSVYGGTKRSQWWHKAQSVVVFALMKAAAAGRQTASMFNSPVPIA